MGLNEHLGDREDVGSVAKQAVRVRVREAPVKFEHPGWDAERECWESEEAKRAYDESLKVACDRGTDVVHEPLYIEGLHLELDRGFVDVLVCLRCGVLHVAPPDLERLRRAAAKKSTG